MGGAPAVGPRSDRLVARRRRVCNCRGDGRMTWIIIRASGVVAYLLVTGATVWGLVVSTGLLGRSVSKKNLTYVHESLSIGSILATIIHMVFLVADNFVEFSVADLLVPGRAGWRPLPVALGVVSFYGLVVITASFYVRRRIGQSIWRYLHYGSFGLFLSALGHGVLAGTDTTHPAMNAMYIATGVLVGGLIVVRAITASTSARTTRTVDVARKAVPMSAADRP